QALEVFRPSEADDKAAEVEKGSVVRVKRSLIFRASDLDGVKYDDLLSFFQQRCDQMLAANDWISPATKRDNAEKRRTVAFLLLTVANVELPGADRTPPAGEKKDKEPVPEDKDKKADEKKDDKGLVFFQQDKKDDQPEKKDEQPEKKDEQPPGPKEPRETHKRPYRPCAFPDTEKPAEPVVGLAAVNQARDDLANVMESLDKSTS